jgi:N-acetylglucosaminyl-diphospho-decaprenol L-rhamnosyltransferase
MDLSIIIVNWNSVAFLRKCLTSVYLNTRDIQFEVIVVDNASFDGCGEMLASEFTQVKFIQTDANLGFAAANNLGFSQSSGRVLLFLNPDTEVIGNAVHCLYSVLKRIHNAGVVGAKLLNADLTVQTSSIQRFPSLINQLIDTDVLRNAFPSLRVWGTWPLLTKQPGPVAVDVISGACMMVDRGLFEAVGFFSSDYFMYSEDVDLCFKVDEAGRQNYYTDDAAVLHHGGGSTKTRKHNHLTDVIMKESRLRFFIAHKGRAYAAVFRATIAAAAIVRFLMLAVALPYRRSYRYGLSKWAAVLRWALWMSPAGSFPVAAAPHMEGKSLTCSPALRRDHWVTKSDGDC